MDLVGLVTTTVEAAAALIVLSPIAGSHRIGRSYAVAWRRSRSPLVSLLGTNLIAGATTTATAVAAPVKSATPNATTTTTTSSSSSGGMAGMSMSSTTAQRQRALSLPTTSPAGKIEWPDDMTTMAAGMKMAEPNCTTQPTAAQQQAAVSLVNQTVASAQKYTSLATAKAAGYVPVTPSGARIVHYINPTIYRAGNALNPNQIPSLVYVNTDTVPCSSPPCTWTPRGVTPPQPGGCLTQWHIHTDLCLSGGRVVGNDSDGSCAAGSVNQVTQPMMHVWMTPVSGGPLARAPSTRRSLEVEAAATMPLLNPQNGNA